MSIDTIVYESKNTATRIALLSGGELVELEIVPENRAVEGNIYLGKIARKVDVDKGKIGFFVELGEGREAFLNAEEELAAWQAASGLPLRKFFNTSGLKYKELGLKDKLPEMPEDRQLALLASDGMLVKRPLLIGGTGAAPAVLVGFREAEWQQLL